MIRFYNYTWLLTLMVPVFEVIKVLSRLEAPLTLPKEPVMPDEERHAHLDDVLNKPRDQAWGSTIG